MFLNRLIARAAGTAPVLKNAPPLAQELADPTWGPVPKPEAAGPEVTGPEVTEPEVAALLPTHRPQAPRPRAPKTASAAPLAFPPSTPACHKTRPKLCRQGLCPSWPRPAWPRLTDRQCPWPRQNPARSRRCCKSLAQRQQPSPKAGFHPKSATRQTPPSNPAVCRL